MRAPNIRTAADPLISLPARRYSVVNPHTGRRTTVDAVTTQGARLVGAAVLCSQPERVLVVEIGHLTGSKVA